MEDNIRTIMEEKVRVLNEARRAYEQEEIGVPSW